MMGNPGDWTIHYSLIVDFMIQVGSLKIRPFVVYLAKATSQVKERFTLSLFALRWMQSEHEMSLLRISIYKDVWTIHVLFIFGYQIVWPKR